MLAFLFNTPTSTFIFCTVDDTCPPLPDTDHVQYNSSSVELGTVVRVSCDEGYLVNETEAITVTCNVTGDWDFDIPPCLRKYSKLTN